MTQCEGQAKSLTKREAGLDQSEWSCVESLALKDVLSLILMTIVSYAGQSRMMTPLASHEANGQWDFNYEPNQGHHHQTVSAVACVSPFPFSIGVAITLGWMTLKERKKGLPRCEVTVDYGLRHQHGANVTFGVESEEEMIMIEEIFDG